MILDFNIFRFYDVVNTKNFQKFKSDNFDELLHLYRTLKLEKPDGQDNFLVSGNTSVWYDRTNTLKHYLNLSACELLPTIDKNFNDSFEDITLARAKQIVKRASGERICISWSGGLDSTVVLFSILQYAELNQIVVYLNHSSIVESGSLFDKYIRGRGISYELTSPCKQPSYLSGLIVNGFLGNQLYGKLEMLSPEHFKMNWKTQFNNQQIEVLEKILENYPQKNIQYLPEFQAFIEMNTKWHQAKYNKKRNVSKDIFDRTVNFFDTVEFQKWSIGNYEPKYLSSDPKTFKTPHREFLRKYMETDIYANNKLIQCSQYHIPEHNWVMLLDNGDNLYLKDFTK